MMTQRTRFVKLDVGTKTVYVATDKIIAIWPDDRDKRVGVAIRGISDWVVLGSVSDIIAAIAAAESEEQCDAQEWQDEQASLAQIDLYAELGVAKSRAEAAEERADVLNEANRMHNATFEQMKELCVNLYSTIDALREAMPSADVLEHVRSQFLGKREDCGERGPRCTLCDAGEAWLEKLANEGGAKK